MNSITQEKFQKLHTEVEFLFQQISNLKNQPVEITDRIEHNCRIGRAKSCLLTIKHQSGHRNSFSRKSIVSN
ncbi:MAG: hypothetical protein MUD14_27030 [Hydrococcus sp. Prado102]|nr:hypothetical protein [Hydrococcus sp. Prado102]